MKHYIFKTCCKAVLCFQDIIGCYSLNKWGLENKAGSKRRDPGILVNQIAEARRQQRSKHIHGVLDIVSI